MNQANTISNKEEEKQNRIRAKKAQRQSRMLDIKKLMKEPFTITMILLISVFLLLFVVYPLLSVFVNGFTINKKIGVDEDDLPILTSVGNPDPCA